MSGLTKKDLSLAIPHKPLSSLDIVTLLLNVIKGKKNAQVGFEDADRTYNQLLIELGRDRVYQVPVPVIESALWSCNLLDEQKKFEHPLGIPFREWLKDLVGKDKFDFKYNYIRSDYGD